jgi:hypothetical protein
MVQRSRDNQKRVSTKRRTKRLRLIAVIGAVIFFGLLVWFVIQYKSVDERLAAIEAARAIPEAENAATLYNQLLDKYDKSVFSSVSVDPNDIAKRKPWLSADYPRLAKWFEERQEIVTNLLHVCKFEKCRFPIPRLPDGMPITVNRLQSTRQWAYFLARSANNDVAEGKIEKALEKYFCILRLGRHSSQQPVALEILTGIGMESIALQRLRFCIIEAGLTDEQIQTIEHALRQSDDEWTREWNDMIEVETLYNKQSPLLSRLKSWWQDWRSNKSIFDRLNEIRLRFLADRRGTHIIIGLRRYKNKNNQWPKSLNDLQPFLDKNILIDPQNNASFVYKLTGDGFVFYSKGKNNVDEGGRKRNGADDWPIWLPKDYKTQGTTTNKR